MNKQTHSQDGLELVGVGSLQLDASIPPLSLSLLETLKLRRSERAFLPDRLPLPQLSRLLWAAYGCNRGDGAQRTAPTPSDAAAIRLYLGLGDGVYLFDAVAMRLERVVDSDIRAATGPQAAIATAAVALVYVVDFSKMAGIADEEKVLLAGLWTGHLSQNVYLFCAAEGLATFAHTTFDRAALERALGLGPHQRVLLAQAVGLPAVPRPRQEYFERD